MHDAVEDPEEPWQSEAPALPLADVRDREVVGRLTSGRPWATYTLMAACLVIFAVSTWMGGSTRTSVLLRLGANLSALVAAGEWWRLWASTFLHIGLAHLLVNMVSLYDLGPVVEALVGAPAFLALYATAGLAGAVLSDVIHAGEPMLAAGASGAIFGLIGALAALGVSRTSELSVPFRTRLARGVVPILAINLLYGFSTPEIDNSTHIGGCVGGFVAMWLLFTVPGCALRQHAVGLGVLLGVGCLPFINEAYALSRASRVVAASLQPRVRFRDPAGRFELTASRALQVEVVPQATGSGRSRAIFRTVAMKIDVQVTVADPTLAERDPEKLAQLLGELGVTARGARRLTLGRVTWSLLPSAHEPSNLVAVATTQQHACVVQCSCLTDDVADVHRELELMLGALRF